MRKCKEIPGQHLFQYYSADGQRHALESGDVNEYLHRHTGLALSAKDFRTWGGTVKMVECLEAVLREEPELAPEKVIKKAVKEVATGLGNTPTVCSKYYIHPQVVELFKSGELIDYLRRHDANPPRPRPALAHRAAGAGDAGAGLKSFPGRRSDSGEQPALVPQSPASGYKCWLLARRDFAIPWELLIGPFGRGTGRREMHAAQKLLFTLLVGRSLRNNGVAAGAAIDAQPGPPREGPGGAFKIISVVAAQALQRNFTRFGGQKGALEARHTGGRCRQSAHAPNPGSSESERSSAWVLPPTSTRRARCR